MPQRRRFQQSESLKERLAVFSTRVRQKTESMPPGTERSELEKKIQQAEIAAEIDGWANSAELEHASSGRTVRRPSIA
jgi:hypothetical protein